MKLSKENLDKLVNDIKSACTAAGVSPLKVDMKDSGILDLIDCVEKAIPEKNSAVHVSRILANIALEGGINLTLTLNFIKKG